MSKLRNEDKFVIERGGSYLTANYETIVDGVAVPLAQQGDKVSGVPGKLFPGPSMVYDSDTGMLDVSIPGSINFVGQITDDYQPPTGQHNSGDFYIVSPDITQHPDGTLTLFEADYPGITPAEYYSLDLVSAGNEYRGSTGHITAFGDGVYTGCVNKDVAESSYGLVLKTEINDGYLLTDKTTLKSGGFGYKVGNIIELKQLKPNTYESAYIKITAVDAANSNAVTDFEFCNENGDALSPGENQLGGLYFASIDLESRAYSQATSPRNATVQGQNLLVDLTMQFGEITKIELSPYSGHTNFKTGDRLFVYNYSIGGFGDGVVEVSIEQNNSDVFTVAYNDKLIYSKRTVDYAGEVTSWVHVKDSTTAVTITDLITPVYNPSISADDEFGNPHKSIVLNRNTQNNNQFEISVKNAAVVFDNNGNVDIFNSYSGLLSVSDKLKIDTIPDIVGRITDVNTTSYVNSYTNENYSPLYIVDNAGSYTISALSSDKGKEGLTQIVNDNHLRSDVITAHHSTDEPVSRDVNYVANSQQISEVFTPLNLFVLPSYQ